MDKEFKEIPEFENYIIYKDGTIFDSDGHKVKYYESAGYYKVALYNDNTMQKVQGLAVHRLVAKTFLEATIENMHVHHIDQNKLNNSVKNLLILTLSEHTIIHKELRIDETFSKIVSLCRKAFKTCDVSFEEFSKIGNYPESLLRPKFNKFLKKTNFKEVK